MPHFSLIRPVTFALLLLGCATGKQGPASGQSAEIAETLQPERARLSMRRLIPAPGLKYLIRLEPAQLLSASAFRKKWAKVFDSERLRAFEKVSGLRLSEIEEMWIAGYPLGTLLLFDARRCGQAAESAFMARARTHSQAKVAGEVEDSWLTAMADDEPQALYHRKGDFIAIAQGDITLAKIVRAYSQGRLQAKSALQTQLLQPLDDVEHEPLVTLYLVGPYAEATDEVIRRFAAARLELKMENTQIRLDLKARGLWPEEGNAQLNEWLLQVLNTRSFRALGLGFPINHPKVVCSAPPSGATSVMGSLTSCQFNLEYDSQALADSVYGITSAPSEELLNLDTPLGNWRSELLGPATP